MSDSIAEFMRNGLAKYADAQRTVVFFRKEVFEVLEQALKAGLADGALVLAEKADIRCANGDYNAQCWLSVFANARLKTNEVTRATRVELGVWWNHPNDREKAPCLVYANLRDDDSAVARFKFTAAPHPSRVREIEGGKWTRVGVTVGNPPDLRQDALDVLAALQAGVGSVPA